MKTYKELVEGINETLSFFLEEEVEDLDEANENFDSNSKAHQAAKKAVKGWRGMSKATYHPDGSATINTKEVTKNRYGKHGHYSGLETTPSHWAVSAHLRDAGGEHGHSRDDLDNHKQKIDGLHWKVKGKIVRGVGRTHEIHIHEGVEGIHEISKDTLKSYTTKRTMGVDPSGSTNLNTISSMKQKAKANSTLGNDAEAARLRTKAKISGNSTAKAYARMGDTGMPGSAVDKAAKKMPASYRKEEFDLDEGRMKDLAMDMESLSHEDFKRKHKRTKQEMQHALKSEGISLDELSRETVRTYYNKAIAQGKPIADKMKMGGGDHSSDGSDTKTLKKRGAGVTMALKRRRGEVKMSEDAEQTYEELKGDQHKIDANKNGKVDGHDFKILRNAKKARYQ